MVDVRVLDCDIRVSELLVVSGLVVFVLSCRWGCWKFR